MSGVSPLLDIVHLLEMLAQEYSTGKRSVKKGCYPASRVQLQCMSIENKPKVFY